MINSLGSHQHVQEEGWEGEGSQSPEGMETVKRSQVPGHLPLKRLPGPHREGQGPTPASSRILRLPCASISQTTEWKRKDHGVTSCPWEERCTIVVVLPNASMYPHRRYPQLNLGPQPREWMPGTARSCHPPFFDTSWSSQPHPIRQSEPRSQDQNCSVQYGRHKPHEAI